MPGLPATARTADRHLWASTSRRGTHEATSDACTRFVRDPRMASPMSATSMSPASALPGREHETRLESSEGDRSIGGEDAVAGLPRQAVDARRDVDSQHLGPVDLWPSPHAVESRAVGGVDHEVDAVDLVRQAGRVVDHDIGAAGSETACSDAPIGSVVPRPGDHDDPSAVGAAQHADRRAGHRRPQPARSARRQGSSAPQPRRPPSSHRG